MKRYFFFIIIFLFSMCETSFCALTPDIFAQIPQGTKLMCLVKFMVVKPNTTTFETRGFEKSFKYDAHSPEKTYESLRNAKADIWRQANQYREQLSQGNDFANFVPRATLWKTDSVIDCTDFIRNVISDAPAGGIGGFQNVPPEFFIETKSKDK